VLADYEWGVRLNGVVQERRAPEAGGSLLVLMFASLRQLSAAAVEAWLAEAEAAAIEAPAGVLGLRASVDRGGFEDAVALIHAAIAEGESYQINYSYRLDFDTFGSPIALYRRLRARQPVAFGALIRLPADTSGPDWVLSCSPELFLRHQDGVLQARPMKGTAARRGDEAADALAARELAADAKNRAENLMIVDLLRNDLGRVARTGSVRVPALFEVEHYPTVLQMTSLVEAGLPDEVSFPDLLRALFPCGSITGAPKHRSMQLIAGLETTARGLYTGSVGWIEAPRGRACGDFCLSVAIRTLTLTAAGAKGDLTLAGPLHRGRMGVGAGVVIDSCAADEYDECRLKARFLTALDPGFSLFETMFATRAGGVRGLDRHLARLAASAAALDFVFPQAQIEAALAVQIAGLPPGTPARLRLALHKDGRLELTAGALEALPPGPVTVLLADRPLDDPHGLGAHKTTLRTRYDEGIRAAQAAGAFDTLFFDSTGRLTEGGRSNVFLYLDGRWRTSPAGPGVLPGTMRGAVLVDPAWAACEMELRVEDLLRAQRIVLTNALRGAVDASLDPAGRRMLTRGRRGHAADPGLHRSGAGGGADQRAG
jgi:para-aminobenzoate synthetase/4-amino-4-deoxychorismate lyase